MRIAVKLKPQAKREVVKKIDDNHFEIAVSRPAIEGQANDRMIDVLAEYIGIAKSRIKIVFGHRSRNKIVEIN